MTMRPYLIAQVANRMVAIDSEQVESVVDVGAVTPVPLAERYIRGLATLRSRVVTVVDTGMTLGIDRSQHAAAARAVIIRVDGHDYAMLVDALEDVASFEMSPVDAMLALDPQWRAATRGVIERDGAPILAIDLAALLPTLAKAA